MNSMHTYQSAGRFEQLYFSLRQKEGRVCSDDEVAQLPFIYSTHPYHREWITRKNSCRALVSYIKHRNNILTILEVGCGNGWLSAKLASSVDVEVTGLDVNKVELEQARRVFKRIPGLHFINDGLQAAELKEKKFDIILFAASIQYFPSLQQVVNDSLQHLTLQGEIHIMDSPFYLAEELAAARQRTKEHFSRMGFPEMSGHYFHHTICELEDFQYKILHHPHSWKNKLSIKKNPFYWIVIKNRYS